MRTKRVSKLIKCLVFALVVYMPKLDAQNNYYFVVETQTAEEGGSPLKHQSTYTVSFLNGVIQTLYDDLESTEYRYYNNDTVYISYKNKSGKEIKGLGTAVEMKQILNSEIDHKRKSLRVSSTGNSEVITGLLCKEVLINYEHKYLGIVLKFENTVWYNNEKKVDQELITADISNIWLKNNYVDSLKALNGFVLKQVLKHNDHVIASMEVKEFHENELDLRPIYYVLEPKKVKKLKPCIREINSVRKANDSFERLNAPRK